MTRNKTILVLAFTPLHQDARVLRQLRGLSRDHDVSVIAYGHLPPELDSRVEMRALETPRGLIGRHGIGLALLGAGKLAPGRAYPRWYWNRSEFGAAVERARDLRPDVIVANDWNALPVAEAIADRTGARVVADMHEYAPTQKSNRGYWRMLYSPMVRYMVGRHLPRAHASITVSQMIADRYRRELGVDMKVVMNAADVDRYPEVRPVAPGRIRLVHHGVCIPERHIEAMIDAVAALGRPYELELMLVERDRSYMRRMRRRADAVSAGNVSFRAPVAPADIVDAISEYDIGVCVHRPITFNLKAVLPNKFFDYVAAGLAVCTGPSPEITRLASAGGYGIVARGFDAADIRDALSRLGASELTAMKQAAGRARDALSARSQIDLLRQIVETL